MSAQHEPPAASTQEKVATAVAPPSAARTDVAARAEETSAVRFVLTDKALDDAFNDVWANNANAISHCYSNTDALKVDFTRTGKRSFLGMISTLPFDRQSTNNLLTRSFSPDFSQTMQPTPNTEWSKAQ
jgi:hypothetical protein